MRTGIGILILAFALLMAVPANAETYGRTGFHLDWWKTDTGDKGMQYHIPMEAGGNIDHFNYKLLTAYAYNEIDPDNADTRSFSGLVDARVNLAYEAVDHWPVDLLFALDLNLPTGKTGLKADDVTAISNSDQVTITRMGEGFNINPSISALKQWDALLASMGIGYIWRGSYDPSTGNTDPDNDLRDYDPGNALNLTAEVDYNFNPQWVGRLFGSWTQFDTDRLAGADYYEPGDVRAFGAGVTYARKEWDLGAVVSTIMRDKDQRQNSYGLFRPEENNYFGDEWIAELRGGMQLSDRIDLKAWLQYTSIAANQYPSSDPNYLGKRAKTGVGCELVGRLSAGWEAGLRLQGYSMKVDDDPVSSSATADFDGGTVAVWATARF